MHSVSDLTTSSRKTTGNVPPKLVGASTTVVGDKMYLFGGRLITERSMMSDLYVFDLDTFVWEKVSPHPDDEAPSARYFHSADSWNNHLIIFGGMGHKPESPATDDLCVLNDCRFLDLATCRWLPSDPVQTPSRTRQPTVDPVLAGSEDSEIDFAADTSVGNVDTVLGISPEAGNHRADSSDKDQDVWVPRARYAHLSSVSSGRLFIIGGQDLNNVWLDDVCVYDLAKRRWASRRVYPRHSGTYRSIAVSADLRVRDPLLEAQMKPESESNTLGTAGNRYNIIGNAGNAKGDVTASENLVHLPYSADPTDEFPNDIYLYSNYNFTDVKRELEVFSPLPGGHEFQMTDRSSQMTGSVFPPGLRFPTGAICGNHLLFAGTYLAQSYQSFSIWALDLTQMTWTRLDPGAALATGSWFRAALWNSPTSGSPKFLIFGNRQGSLVEDYNRRLLSWDDVAVVDLEAFGIYQPPRLLLDLKSQELGLAALEEGLMTDFEIVCEDGRKIACSRKLLENRWPWFRDQRKLFLDAAKRALENIPGMEPDNPLPPDPIVNAGKGKSNEEDLRPDPRLTSRSLILSELYPVCLALLQYFYTLALLTPVQHAPAVLSHLMVLSSVYNIPHLQSLVKHAMHRALAPATSVGVYEVATLCSSQGLQIRALKAVMSSSRRAPGRARGNSSAGGGGGGGNDGNGGGHGGGHGAARPRGMSDLRGLGRPDGVGGAGAMMSTNSADGGNTNGTGHALEFSTESANSMNAVSRSIASPIPKRVRGNHTVNLSMDSLYQALNSADDYANDPYMNDDSAESQIHFPAPPSPTIDHPTARTENEPVGSASPSPVRRPVYRAASNPALSTGVSISPTVSRTTSNSSLTNMSTAHHYHQQMAMQRNNRFANGQGHSTGLNSGVSPSVSNSHHPSRLGIPRSHSDGSDTPSLISSRTSTISSGSGRSRPSPMTPESPPLPTPAEAFSVMAYSGAPLSAIDESSIYEESLTSLSNSRGGAVEVVDHTVDTHVPNWKDTNFRGHGVGVLYGKSHVPPEPLSPSQSSFHHGSDKASSSDRHSESSRFASGMGLGMGVGKQIFSSKTLKAEKEAAKARAKAEKLEKKAAEKALADQRMHEARAASVISLGNSESMSIWSDSRDVKKAAKAEEKRRKKEEEKKKLEMLAQQLKGGKTAKDKDMLSLASSGSTERRRNASRWMEESDGGLYGGLAGWGSL